MKKLLVFLIPLFFAYAPTVTFYSEWGWGYYFWLFGPVGPSQSEGMAAAGYSGLEYRGYTQFALGGWPGGGTQINSLVLRLRNNTGGAGLQIDINRVTSDTPDWYECGGTSPLYLTNQPVGPNAEEYTYFDLTATQAVNDLLAAWQSGTPWFGFGFKGSRGSGEPCMHFFYAFWADPIYDGTLIVDYVIGVAETQVKNPQVPILAVYPNPFRRATTIKYQILSTASQASSKSPNILRIYNASGRLVKSFSPPTAYCLLSTSVEWDGTGNSGYEVPPGVYFIRFEFEGHEELQKIIRLE